MSNQSLKWSPAKIGRLASAFYIMTILAGSASLLIKDGVVAVNIVADASYMAVIILFYFLFKPTNQAISLFAAMIGVAGCLNGLFAIMRISLIGLNSLVFFGVYCLLIGYLVIASKFLPKFLGVMMVAGGLGWLTFISPALVHQLFPYNLAPGIVAETTLTLWLLIKGADDNAAAASTRPTPLL